MRHFLNLCTRLFPVQEEKKKTLRPLTRHLILEGLEERALLSVSPGIDSPSLETAANEYIVTTLADVTNAADEVLSLREAIAAASTGDKITFDASLSGGTITLSGTQLTINKGITIDASSLEDGITLDANQKSRVFYISGGTSEAVIDVELRGLTMTNGKITGYNAYGGGIYNEKYGNLKLIDCVITRNNAASSGEESNSYGGGIYNANNASLTVTNCVISNNSAQEADSKHSFNYGGGICSKGQLNLVNSVIVANSVSSFYFGKGGGIYTTAQTTLTNCTVAGNTGQFTGGIFSDAQSITLNNTILAINYGGNLDGIVQSSSNSYTTNDPGFVTAPIFDYYGVLTNAEAIDLHLKASSWLIDAGNSSKISAATDVEGNPRVSGSAVDIGAYEFQGTRQVSEAVSLVVTTTEDTFDATDGKTSLREAIFNAKTGETITFDASLSGKTIYPESAEYFIAKGITIDATSLADGIHFYGNQHGRFIYLLGEDADHAPELIGLTLYRSRSFWGGGVYNVRTAKLTRCTFYGNIAQYGGGIGNIGDLTMTNCVVAGSISGYGAAFYNYSGGKLTLNNCTVTGCSSTYGSGIYNPNGTVYLNNTLLALNSHANVEKEITESHNSFVTNDPGFVVAPTTDNYGNLTNINTLDLHLKATSWLVNAGDSNLVSTVTDRAGNTRIYGTAVDIGAYETQEDPAEREAVSLVVTTEEDSFDSADGKTSLREAILNAQSGDTITFDASLSGKTITLGGAELYFERGVTIDASSLDKGITIDGNARSHVLYYAIRDVQYAAKLINVTVKNGRAFWGGGIALNKDNTLTLTNCAVTGSEAYESGGGIWSKGNLTITDSKINENDVNGYFTCRGGGIYSDGAFIMTNSSVIGNSAHGGENLGGGLYMGGSFTITDCEISQNIAKGVSWNGYGAGIYISYSSGTLTDCIISDNVCSGNDSSYGGGLCMMILDDTNTSIAITNCSFAGNKSVNGGGIYIKGNSKDSITITQCSFTKNESSTGGGLYNNGDWFLPKIKYCIFSENSATVRGGGIYNWYSYTSITNCLLVKNTAGQEGGGIYHKWAEITMTNCTVANNSASNGGGITYCGELALYNSVIARNTSDDIKNTGTYRTTGYNNLTTFTGWTQGRYANNILDDLTTPIFMDEEKSDYHLNPLSPAIDSGNNSYIKDISTDLDGKARIVNDVVDMGVYEYTPLPITDVTISGYNEIYDGKSHGVTLTGTHSGDQLLYSLNQTDWSENEILVKNVSSQTVYVKILRKGYITLQLSAAVVITPKQLTISGTSIADKPYDGTTSAMVTLGTLGGVCENDNVTAAGFAVFPSALPGSYQLTVTYAISGDDVANYLTPISETLPASIQKLKLNTPELTASGLATLQIQVSWNTIPNANLYRLEYSTDVNFTSVTAQTTTETSLTLSGFQTETCYYFRVRAEDTTNLYAASEYSDPRSVTLHKFKLDTPKPTTSNITVSSITVSWNPIANASEYAIQYRIKDAAEWSSSQTLTETEYQFTQLASDTEYEFRVMANPCDPIIYEASDWGYAFEKTNGPLPAPTLTVTPSAENPSHSLTASWNTIESAIGYELVYSFLGDFTDAQSVQLGANETEWTLSGIEIPATTYYFKVKAFADQMSYLDSPYCDPVAGTTAMEKLAAPTGFVSKTSSTGGTYTWAQTTNAVGYYVEWGTYGDFSHSMTIDTSIPKKYCISGLTPGTHYQFRITSIGDHIHYLDSDYSIFDFVTTEKDLTAPTLTITGTTYHSISVGWTPGEDEGSYVQGYVLAYCDDYNPDVFNEEEGRPEGTWIEVDRSKSQAFWTLDGLEPKETRYFIVKALGDGVVYADSPWSVVCPGTTDLYYLKTPQLDAVCLGTSVTVKWNAVEKAKSYDLLWKKDSDTEWTQVRLSKDVLSQTFDNLDRLTIYNFKVAALGDGPEGPYVDSSYAEKDVLIDRIALEAPVLTVTNVTSETISLEWNEIQNASYYNLFWTNGEASEESLWELYCIDGSSRIDNTALTVSRLPNDDTGQMLSPGTTYSFKVMALGDGFYKNSPDSNIVSPTTLSKRLGIPEITLEGGATTLSIFWNEIPNASSYKIEYWQTGKTHYYIEGVTETSYLIEGLTSWKQYNVRITAIGDGTHYTNSLPSEIKSAYLIANRLDAPLNLNAVQTSEGIQFTWTSDPNAVGYTLKWSIDKETWNEISVPNEPIDHKVSYLMEEIPKGSDICYFKLVALADGINYFDSADSVMRTLHIVHSDQLDTPENLAYATYGANRAHLSWDAVEEAVGYTVSYSADGENWLEVTTETTTAIVTGLTYGTLYQYKVRALAEEGGSFSDSEDSEPISYCVCPMDINSDGKINLLDYRFFSASYMAGEGDENYDFRCNINGVGKVNVADWPYLSQNYGKKADDPSLVYPPALASAVESGLEMDLNFIDETIDNYALESDLDLF